MDLKIFVIDDEKCIRDTLRWHLEAQGHMVITASEPMACQIYQGHDCSQERPCGDLLFVDYHMPKMTGLEFIEHMARRGCKGAPQNKVIISGNTANIDQEKILELGCQVLQKPVSFDQIDKIVVQAKQRALGNGDDLHDSDFFATG